MRGEPRWPASLAVLAALLMYVTLPHRLVLGPVWIVPALELALLIPLSLTAPRRHHQELKWQRIAAVVLIAIINAANVASLVLLVRFILLHGTTSGVQLLSSSISIWLTNVIVFGLWYWELDRGGPHERASPHHLAPDFLFPQMVTPGCAREGWAPKFIDYLYIAFTCATALGPTDTMPLSQWAKMLMLLQALTSLLTVALVAARAVSILG